MKTHKNNCYSPTGPRRGFLTGEIFTEKISMEKILPKKIFTEKMLTGKMLTKKIFMQKISPKKILTNKIFRKKISPFRFDNAFGMGSAAAAVLPLLSLLLCLAVSGCTREKIIPLDRQARKEYRIAVVLPLGGDQETHWRRSIDWALENLAVPLVCRQGIRITAEWYDEETAGTEALFTRLAAREDIAAIIGPLYSDHAVVAARCCAATDKPLIPALASSELLMRPYVGKGFLWCLTENDISQCEILLTLAIQKGAKSVSLLTPDNLYGQTFLDWFAFQAKELKLDVHGMEVYAEANLEEKMKLLLAKDTDYLICVPSGAEATRRMNALSAAAAPGGPRLLFSDLAFFSDAGSAYEGMEGVAQIQDPQSGFHLAYEARYGIPAGYGSAHFYDAALLAGLGILKADLTGDADLNDAIRSVVSAEGEDINGCTDGGVDRIVSELIAGASPHPTGASGKLRFNAEAYTNVLHSVFCHWLVYQGNYLVLEYTTSDDNNRTGSSVVNWNWRVTQMQDFSDAAGRQYPPKTGLYALILAPSAGWENYRHQADACAFYQLLKAGGLGDDHILMVVEDDIAFDTRNLYPGIVRTSPSGENVYSGVRVDYHPSEITLDALADVLTGQGEGGMMKPSATDNLLVYWAGHGDPEGPRWLDRTIPAGEAARFFRRLSEARSFRKSLFVLETCYAGKVGEALEGIPGLVCLAAAAADETSKVNSYSAELHTWLSNSFTDALLEAFAARPDDTLYALYGRVYGRTLGSHVSVYNAAAFDNLYTAGFREFLSR